MKTLYIGMRREVLWDEELMDQVQKISVRMHRPEYRNLALVCDKPWEGNVSGYFSVFQDEGKYRLYYRAWNLSITNDGEILPHHHAFFCTAESMDNGKTFERVPVGKIPFWGHRDTNILIDEIRDNMFFFRDTNPNSPLDERYKGLAADYGETQVLCYYKSKDGINFEKVRILADDGAYDSLNVSFWNEEEQQYYLFYRGLHGQGAVNGKWSKTAVRERHNTLIRDVRVRTSKDFVHWSEPRMIQFIPKRDDLELYTNQVQQYYRARHMLIGFPTRYVDRYQDKMNFRHLPDKKHRDAIIRYSGREGTAMTDAAIMTSRDGLHFRRTEEAFLTPGPERGKNWYYGDCYIAYGMTETPSSIPGAPNEISIYNPIDYNTDCVRLARFAVRLDGFFSWHADYTPGHVVTHPIVFEGNMLSINFATSALGYVQIRLLDVDGNLIEGYDSGKLFGDSVDRIVDFKNSLGELARKKIRMEIAMSDAEFYSFKFFEIPEVL